MGMTIAERIECIEWLDKRVPGMRGAWLPPWGAKLTFVCTKPDGALVGYDKDNRFVPIGSLERLQSLVEARG